MVAVNVFNSITVADRSFEIFISGAIYEVPKTKQTQYVNARLFNTHPKLQVFVDLNLIFNISSRSV